MSRAETSHRKTFQGARLAARDGPEGLVNVLHQIFSYHGRYRTLPIEGIHKPAVSKSIDEHGDHGRSLFGPDGSIELRKKAACARSLGASKAVEPIDDRKTLERGGLVVGRQVNQK